MKTTRYGKCLFYNLGKQRIKNRTGTQVVVFRSCYFDSESFGEITIAGPQSGLVFYGAYNKSDQVSMFIDLCPHSPTDNWSSSICRRFEHFLRRWGWRIDAHETANHRPARFIKSNLSLSSWIRDEIWKLRDQRSLFLSNIFLREMSGTTLSLFPQSRFI